MPILEAIESLAATRTITARIATALQQSLRLGNTLSEALGAHPLIFAPEEVALVKAGEETGRLDAILDRIAILREEVRQAQSHFVSNMIWPVLTFHVAALVMPIGLSAALTGRINFTLATTITTVIICGFWGLAIFGWITARTPVGRARMRAIAEMIPGMGSAVRHRRYALFATTLEAAYESGVTLDRGVTLAADAAGATGGALATQMIAAGKPLRDALPATSILPPHLLSRIAVSEQSGELSGELRRIATEEFSAARTALDRTITITTRGFYVLLAIAVFFYALTILSGISSL